MGNVAKYLLLSAKEDLDKSVNIASITKGNLDASIERGDLNSYYLARETDDKISQSENRTNNKIDEIKDQIANLVNVFLPIGIYVDYANGTDPNQLYPGTRWERIEGRVRVGVSSDEEFNSVNKTGGEKAVALTIGQLPPFRPKGDFLTYESDSKFASLSEGSNYGWSTVGEVGGGGTHNNLQPYITCYMWHRIA